MQKSLPDALGELVHSSIREVQASVELSTSDPNVAGPTDGQGVLGVAAEPEKASTVVPVEHDGILLVSAEVPSLFDDLVVTID